MPLRITCCLVQEHLVGLRKLKDMIYLHQGGYVIPGVCLTVGLPVCLLGTARNTTNRIFVKISLKMQYIVEKND